MVLKEPCCYLCGTSSGIDMLYEHGTVVLAVAFAAGIETVHIRT